MGGWLGGWGQVNIKDHTSPAKLELGLSLAIIQTTLRKSLEIDLRRSSISLPLNVIHNGNIFPTLTVNIGMD